VATWQDLVDFVQSEYEVVERRDDELRILIEYEEQRSQVVIVGRDLLDEREDWVQVASVCALANDVDLRRLLEEIARVCVLGGAVIMGEHVVLRHSLPLRNLDINEFTDPLNFVAETADYLEEMFAGGDGY
jgi:hypothetical protein